MMHRKWRHDAFATQIWCCSLGSQWWDICPKMWRSHTSLGVAQHHLPKANIVQKDLFCPVDKRGLFVGAGSRTWTCMREPSLEPESSASANSAIPAYITGILRCNSRYYTAFVCSCQVGKQENLILKPTSRIVAMQPPWRRPHAVYSVWFTPRVNNKNGWCFVDCYAFALFKRVASWDFLRATALRCRIPFASAWSNFFTATFTVSAASADFASMAASAFFRAVFKAER